MSAANIKIYPDSCASLCIDQAGQKYRPSNGTEGEIFMLSWCGHCQRDLAMRNGEPIEECDDNESCTIIARTQCCDVDDPEYPVEWQYGKDGQPCCTAFVAFGQPIPAKDDRTLDMFVDPAPASPTKAEGL